MLRWGFVSKFLSISMVVVSLAACGSMSVLRPSLNNVSELGLLPPESLNRNIGMIQKIHVRTLGDEFHYESVVEITNDRIHMLLLQPWGQRIATLTYNSGEFTLVRASGASTKLPFRRMLSTMQMIFWPGEAIMARQGESSWFVIDSENMREIYRNQQLVGIAEYDQRKTWPSNVIYWDITYNYQITISSVLLD